MPISKKHIVIDARELRTSSGRYVERLLNYLQQIDHSHKYSVLLKPNDFDNWQPSNKLFTKVLCPFKEFTFGEQLGLNYQIIQLHPDLVHFSFTQQPVLYKGRVVTTVHDLTTTRFKNPSKNPVLYFVKQQIYKWVIRRIAHKSNSLIVPTEYVKEDLAKFAKVNSRKITVTYESADLIPEKAEPIEYLKEQKFIMYVGRSQPHKNLYRLLAAFTILRKNYPDLKLVLAGKIDATYKMISNFVSEQGLENVFFTDFISEARLKWLYQNCRAYIFPSLSEGFGLPGLEAMRHGAPVISSNLTSMPEVYGDAALYFDPNNVDDIKDKIEQVLKNTQLRKSLIEKGKRQVDKYSWKKMAEQTLKTYQSTLGEKD